MGRRSFLSGLLGLPFLSLLAKVEGASPVQSKSSPVPLKAREWPELPNVRAIEREADRATKAHQSYWGTHSPPKELMDAQRLYNEAHLRDERPLRIRPEVPR